MASNQLHVPALLHSGTTITRDLYVQYIPALRCALLASSSSLGPERSWKLSDIIHTYLHRLRDGPDQHPKRKTSGQVALEHHNADCLRKDRHPGMALEARRRLRNMVHAWHLEHIIIIHQGRFICIHSICKYGVHTYGDWYTL